MFNSFSRNAELFCIYLIAVGNIKNMYCYYDYNTNDYRRQATLELAQSEYLDSTMYSLKTRAIENDFQQILYNRIINKDLPIWERVQVAIELNNIFLPIEQHIIDIEALREDIQERLDGVATSHY